MSGNHLSKDFFELVKSIGESKSKQEEDRIIISEVAQLKRKMNEVTGAGGGSASSQVNKKKKEFLIRLMYVEMLGHDASFGYIKAVEMTASTNLMQKRVGYLTCSLTLSPTHEFRFMIINQLQRDLQSSNHLEVCAALMAVCKLVTVEMIPAVQPMILELLRHDAEIVRKKAVMALHRFHQLNPDAVTDIGDSLRRTLCDRDPSVMGAALCILHDLAVSNPADYKDLVPSYVSILKQITEHRLPREFDYHRIPAPWIQIRLLKILALLGQADQQTSEGMYEVLHDVMRRADTGINVGYAIIYESVRTVTTIYPNSTLLDAAAASISRFISSDNHNLKYLGVTGLAAIVKDHPRYAAAHQMAVIDCLEDPDETLKRKTLDLLYRMTNPVNVEFISDKLTQFLREASDEFLRKELVSRITQCAERYAPSNAWYIQTMTNVFELGGDLVRDEVAHNLLRLIAEGSGEDEEQDMELRRDAVETYLDLLERPVLADILVCTMGWVLGEYGFLSDTMELEEICERLCELVERPFNQEDKTRGYILSAVTKITAQMGHSIDMADAMMNKYKTSRSTDLQQRCFEYLALKKNPDLMAEVFPEDASCEDIEVDPNLAFLTSFVQQAAAKGAPLYDPPEESDEEERAHTYDHNRLNFEAYQKPEIPYNVKLPPNEVPGQNRWGAPQQPFPQQDGSFPQGPGVPSPGNVGGWPGQDTSAKRAVKNVWGPTGMNVNEPAPPAAQQDPYGRPGQYPPQGAPQGQPGQYYGNQAPSQQLYGSPGSYPQEPPAYNEEEAQPDERQMMASALFGGIPGAPNPVPGGQRRSVGSSRTLVGARRTSVNRAGNRRVSRQDSGGAPVEATPSPQYEQQQQRYTSHHQGYPPQAPPQPRQDVDLLDMSYDGPPASSPVPPAYNQSPVPQTADPFGAVPPSVTTPPEAGASLDPFNMGGLASAVPGKFGLKL
jgi:AP-4 complex subunit epsilon-1